MVKKVKYLVFRKKKKKSINTGIIFSRIGIVSQVLMACVAIFGYFYTVVPVYQKEMLAEDISKKEIELNSKNLQIEVDEDKLKQISDEIKVKNYTLDKIMGELNYHEENNKELIKNNYHLHDLNVNLEKSIKYLKNEKKSLLVRNKELRNNYIDLDNDYKSLSRDSDKTVLYLIAEDYEDALITSFRSEELSAFDRRNISLSPSMMKDKFVSPYDFVIKFTTKWIRDKENEGWQKNKDSLFLSFVETVYSVLERDKTKLQLLFDTEKFGHFYEIISNEKKIKKRNYFFKSDFYEMKSKVYEVYNSFNQLVFYTHRQNEEKIFIFIDDIYAVLLKDFFYKK